MVEKYYKINSSKFWNDVCSMKKDGFEIIKIFLNTIERKLNGDFLEVKNFEKNTIKIKDNRIFFVCSNEKIFSIKFCKKILFGEWIVFFEEKPIEITDIKILMIFLELLKEAKDYEEFAIKFYEIVDDNKDFSKQNIDIALKILKTLFEIEWGYFRYDYDMNSEKLHGVNKHPAHHIDIFYDESIKLGIGDSSKKLKSKEIEKIFDRLLNKEEDRFFLKDMCKGK
jgi:hypothetical protein